MKGISTLMCLLCILFGVRQTCVAQTDECAAAPLRTFSNYPGCGMAWVHNVSNATFTARTASVNVGAPTCSTTAPRDIWYRFVVPAGITSLGFHAFNSGYIPIFSAGARPCMAVYRGADCNSLTQLGCFLTTNQAFMQNGYLLFRNVSGLIPGEVIYMRVWDFNNRNYGLAVAVSYQTTQFTNDNCLTPAQLGTSGCNIFAQGGDVAPPGDPPCPNWTVMDNSMFYSFTVTASTPQPVTINATSTLCTGTPFASVQLAVYNWNGANCTGVGGSGATYHGCATGSGTVTWTGNLPVGNYMLVMDGESGFGSSLCSFGFASPVIPLPLENYELSGWAHSGHNALQWKSLMATPSASLDLQRSTDGVQFQTLASLDHNATTGSHADFDLAPNQPAYLYRLVASDFDGGLHFSNTVQIVPQPQYFQLYPTVIDNGSTRLFFGGDMEEQVSIQVISLTGQVLQQLHERLLPSSVLHIPLRELESGIYFVRVIGSQNTKTFRVLVP